MASLSAQVLSIESQLRIRELLEYVETSRTMLSRIHELLLLFKSHPEDVVSEREASVRLGSFCMEADSWGFNDLYLVGSSLLRLLLNLNTCDQDSAFWKALERGLAMLSDLLEQCEPDFRRRLAVADTLDSLTQFTQ